MLEDRCLGESTCQFPERHFGLLRPLPLGWICRILAVQACLWFGYYISQWKGHHGIFPDESSVEVREPEQHLDIQNRFCGPPVLVCGYWV